MGILESRASFYRWGGGAVKGNNGGDVEGWGETEAKW